MIEWLITRNATQQAISVASTLLKAGLEKECLYVIGETIEGVRWKDQLEAVRNMWRNIKHDRTEEGGLVGATDVDATFQEEIEKLGASRAVFRMLMAGLPAPNIRILHEGPGLSSAISEGISKALGERLARLGTEWIEKGQIEGANLFAASCRAASPSIDLLCEFSGALHHVRHRALPSIDSEILERVSDLAKSFAEAKNYPSAVRLGIIVPFLLGDKHHLQEIFRRTAQLHAPTMSPAASKIEQDIEMQLLGLGYPAQAADLFSVVLDRPETPRQATWEPVWNALQPVLVEQRAFLRQPRVTDALIRHAKGAAASVASTLRVLTTPSVSFDQVVDEVTGGIQAGLPQKRQINVWVEEDDWPLIVNTPYTIAINIGGARENAQVSVPFREPDWGDRDEINLLFVVTGEGFKIDLPVQSGMLSKYEDMPPVWFGVTPLKGGFLELCVSIFLEGELTLLEEFNVAIESASPSHALS